MPPTDYITIHGRIFLKIGLFWSNLRYFAYRNRTIFEALFVIVYTVEQAFLVWFTYLSTDIIELSFIISMFAIVVLTTFALHKLVMESRIRVLESKIKETFEEKNVLENKVRY